MPSPSVPVLIAGAGPTGLMLACELARHGIDFRIVDYKSGATRESRALAVQARSLELWQALGIADDAVAAGRPMLAANLYVGGRRVQRLPLADIGAGLTPFPFVLILEQSRNEALLYARLKSLGHAVDWTTELADFRDGPEGVHCLLRHADERMESLHVRWLVGCDGAKSRVRERLGLAFVGGTYENAFYVADTRVDWELPHGELTACLSRETFVLFFPMPGGVQRYRVIGILPRDGSDEPDLRFEDIEAAVRAQMDIPVRFSETAWFSAYRVHHRSVERFRAGHCFLAGDAAHVHSPVGAQGMNTGLQDAANLAWKLALVVQGRAHARLLESYHAERWPFAQRLLASTDRAFRVIIARGPLLRTLRLRVFPWLAARLMGRRPVRRRLFRLVSQTGLHYRASPLSAGSSATLPGARAGDRLPYAEIGTPLATPALSVYAWLAAPRLHLVLMQRDDPAGLQALAEDWRARLQRRHPHCIDLHALVPGQGADGLFAALGVRRRALLLVRPDQYIAWVARRFDLDALQRHLEQALQLKPAR